MLFILVRVAAVLSMAVIGLVTAASADELGFARTLPEQRFALVIGNTAYRMIKPLRNPTNDVRLIRDKLVEVGFTVDLVEDADLVEMKTRIRAFAERVGSAGKDAVALLYYAGHGVQDDKNRNYLIPVDAQLRRQVDLVDGAVRLEYAQELIEDARPKFSFVILDACRDNPLPTRGGSRGLARVDPRGRNTFIAFSTGPGEVADDGEFGGNSPYAAALASELAQPASSVDETFRKVQLRVDALTNGRQSPWRLNNIQDMFTFVTPRPAVAMPGEAATAPTTPPVNVAALPSATQDTKSDLNDPDLEYQKAVLADSLEGYESFLQRFPRHVRRDTVVKLIQRKREDVLWRRIEQEPDANRQLGLLDLMINAFADGGYVDRAKRRRAELIDRLNPPAPSQPTAVPTPLATPVYVPPPSYAPPTPAPTSPLYAMVDKWAVGSGSNCGVSRQSYWFSSDGGTIRWRNGAGNVDVESVISVSGSSFGTRTIGSPTVPAGTIWTYSMGKSVPGPRGPWRAAFILVGQVQLMPVARPSRRGVLTTAASLTLVSGSTRPSFGQDAPAPGRARSERPSRATAREPWLTLPTVPPIPETRWGEVKAADGAALAYGEFGQGDRPVLFLHGGYGSSNCWAQQIIALSDQNRIIALDTRGHGRSRLTSKTFGFGAFARDVETLLDSLKIPTVAIVGWSDGGITGLQLAMSKPSRVSRLFAFGANVNSEGVLAGGSRKPTFAAYVSRCKAEYDAMQPDRWTELVSGCRAMWRREPNFPWHCLGKITAAVTVATSPYDELIRPDHARRIVQAVPGAKLVKLNNVSHFAMYQDPAGFTSALRTFLAA